MVLIHYTIIMVSSNTRLIFNTIRNKNVIYVGNLNKKQNINSLKESKTIVFRAKTWYIKCRRFRNNA